ncbi:WYL domain-containing protein [Bacillus safensis]|uniref:helix-turn-helix transcriptional regulator n=1 Tax=Bacillus TaxID=1386 RepID=UPI000CCC7672|nr:MULTISPECIES: WYL domain-containing protein [Bacillus]PNU24799.1 transcriptional regulator [Bacillus stratosphericus]MCY7568239.1 WYL domain-containing protein [Bacillus safensis]MEC1413770.1 WYL domain-containing protein [Bacillus safensis]QNH46901.1 WYL domain-containing protein [Bacillus sp. PAMC28571]QNK44757.1 WYL domain-containing protein [Bacillus sp. PAMC22265]
MKKSERLNQELIFLSDKHSFQLKDLQSEFGISKRTALRDIEELESMGLAFYVESGRHGGYRLVNQSPLVPIYFNIEEVQAIFFALKALDLVSATPFKKSYSQIRQKLFATMSDERKQMITETLDVIHYYNVAPVSEQNHLELILQAMMKDQIVKMTYTQYENKWIRLQFLELFYRNGIWFSQAYDVQNKKWGIYRCDFMKDMVIEEEIRDTFTKEELKELQLEYEKTYHDISFKCRLTEQGKEKFLKHHYPNMRLEIIDQIPYIVGGYNQEELSYMTHYLMSFGKHVKIEYPDELKESYLNQLREVIDKY